jgi:hypothetical protein
MPGLHLQTGRATRVGRASRTALGCGAEDDPRIAGLTLVGRMDTLTTASTSCLELRIVMTEALLSGGQSVTAAAHAAEPRVSCREEPIGSRLVGPALHGIRVLRVPRPFLSSGA